MNTDLQSQTELLLKALTQLHSDLGGLNTTLIVGCAALFALLLFVAFRRQTPRQPKQLTKDQEEMLFIRHVEAMDKKHPDWLKIEPTSHMAVAREFWDAGRRSR